MIKIAFVVWDASEEELKLVENIKKHFIEQLGQEADIKIIDAKQIEDTKYGEYSIIFGEIAKRYVDSTLRVRCSLPNISLMMPDHEDCKKNKKGAWSALVQAATAILTLEKEEPTLRYIETPEGITVGPEDCQINITEREAEHLKKIRDILGGGKMVIVKGDLRIEVE